MKINKDTIITILALIIIGIITYIMIWNNKPNIINKKQKQIDSLEICISQYDTIINKLNDKTNLLTKTNALLELKVDSLIVLKSKIKELYNETYTYINHASNIQLDSIIRTNW